MTQPTTRDGNPEAFDRDDDSRRPDVLIHRNPVKAAVPRKALLTIFRGKGWFRKLLGIEVVVKARDTSPASLACTAAICLFASVATGAVFEAAGWFAGMPGWAMWAAFGAATIVTFITVMAIVFHFCTDPEPRPANDDEPTLVAELVDAETGEREHTTMTITFTQDRDAATVDTETAADKPASDKAKPGRTNPRKRGNSAKK